ncbi:MAG TPA: AAA family ATPase [Alphaproteobacteria bacterium]|nr:AAA family ATPase [Alphaproteobacteria bacterium]
MSDGPKLPDQHANKDGDRKIMDELVRDARVERWSRMMPATAADDPAQPVDPELLQTSIDNIRGFKRHSKKSDQAIARMAGVSTSVVNEILHGRYKGNLVANVTRIEAAITEWYNKRAAPAPGRFVWTQVALEIRGIIRFVTKQGSMGVFVGESGIGKSMCMDVVRKVHYPSAILVTINAGTSSPLNFCRAILKQVSAQAAKKARRRADAFQAITSRLTGSHRLVMIDEADGLRMDTLNEIRQIHDATGCPVVMAGRPPLLDKITRSMRDERIGGSARGRICIQQDLHGVVQNARGGKGGRMLFSQEEIKEIFSKYQVTVTAGAARYLCALANISAAAGDCESGGLRYAIAVFLLAVNTNKGAATGRGITLDMVRAANRACRGDIFVESDHQVQEFIKEQTA